MNTAVSNLMRIALSKSSKEANTAQQSNQLKLPTDSSKLEKQLKSLISKFESGSSIVPTIYYNKSLSKIFLLFRKLFFYSYIKFNRCE